MKQIFKILFASALTLSLAFPSWAQDRFAPIEAKLKELAVKETPGLNDKVDLSVNGTAIQDFIRAIATTSNLNVSIDPSLNAKIYNNFSNVNVIDVFMFLCKKNDLDITFVGSIISFSPYNAPKAPVQAYVPKEIKITYDKNTQFITMDLKNDSLPQVVKELTRITEKNVVYAPELGNKILNGFILNMPFAKAMEQLSFSNELKISSSEDNIYTIEKKDKDAPAKGNQPKSSTAPVQGLTVKQELNSHISIDAVNVPIADMVANVSKELGYNYFLFSEIKGNASLKLSNVTYDEFLTYVFNGSDFTFKKQADIYMLGDRNLEGLRVTKLVQLKYRTIDKITDFIPADLKKGVDIKIFPDLNGIILSGSLPRITEIEDFIRKVDQVVPVITIEIMIADVKKYHKVSTGIEAGVGKKTSGGTVFPELNYTLGSSTINDLISGINGFGIINLGSVTPNFYISLKAMEDEGIIKVRSTPQLATLNGHEAKMSVGSTQYYSETSTVLSGSLTGGSQTNTVWKSVTADLAITVNPIVSGNEQITLDISVTQSDFTAPQGIGAPPGNVKKDFKSLIRVKNGEMIILGGLEERRNENTGRGVPLLSRIPILKWFFSSRTKARSSDKLTVFIKPTVLY